VITPEDIADGEGREEDTAGLKVDAEAPGAEVCFLGEIDPLLRYDAGCG